MFDQSLSKSQDLSDMLRLLPGVVVQEYMTMQEMALLYGIEPDLLECLVKSSIEPLSLEDHFIDHCNDYKLDHYLSDFLQDRDRSQLHYCDPMVQHISICCRILSLLNGTNALDLDLDS